MQHTQESAVKMTWKNEFKSKMRYLSFVEEINSYIPAFSKQNKKEKINPIQFIGANRGIELGRFYPDSAGTTWSAGRR